MNFAEIAADFVREHMDSRWTDAREAHAAKLRRVYNAGKKDGFYDGLATANAPQVEAPECCGGGACHRANE